MTERVYRISKWSETFETADSRRHKTLSWVSLPVVATNGYHDLIDTFGVEAPAIYGAWCALLKVAAEAPQRGTLATSRGVAYSLNRIARATGMPEEVFSRLFEWATTERVKWLEVTTPLGDDQPPNDNGLVDERATEPNRTEPTEPDLTKPTIDRYAAGRAGGGWYAGVQIDGERWQEQRDRMQSVLDAVKPSPTFRASPKDVALIARAVFFEHRFDLDVIDSIVDSIGELTEPPKRPFGYFKKSMVNACDRLGVDFYAAMRAIKLPLQPPAPRRVIQE